MCTQYRESHSTRHVENVSLTDVTEGTVDLSLYILKGKGKGRFGYQVELLLEGKKVSMEIDTGSAVSIISEREYNNLLKDLQLRPTRIHLKTYSGEQLPLL